MFFDDIFIVGVVFVGAYRPISIAITQTSITMRKKNSENDTDIYQTGECLFGSNETVRINDAI